MTTYYVVVAKNMYNKTWYVPEQEVNEPVQIDHAKAMAKLHKWSLANGGSRRYYVVEIKEEELIGY